MRHIDGRVLLRFSSTPFLAALVIASVDSLALYVAFSSVPGQTLALVLFFEGGSGLILGVGIALSSTPSVSKAGERLFGTSPWSRDAERHAERVGWKWMLGSTFLIVIGFIASAI
ncbi:hypothetical protein J2P12_03400 [Candidatus Bathyarchaeota archaeon]|nr:hypothetical protein [Candidatus Bathyarchaeota archaeon]